MRIRRAALAAVVAVCFSIAGCNAFQKAQKAHDIVGAVVAVAQADLPSLQATGVFNASEAAAVTNYLNLTVTLNGQYQTCITSANSATLNKKGKFVTCLDTFAQGLSDPRELAQLRVMRPGAQQQVQLWITAASVGVSSVIAALGGSPVVSPQVSKVVTRDEWRAKGSIAG
ncbi:MAG TPA: hypothetical protein VFW94_14760 [Candidatus Acidoferrales bacterium]|nr:hypothetical protein [Candidatus Acidoferrales bacterium]